MTSFSGGVFEITCNLCGDVVEYEADTWLEGMELAKESGWVNWRKKEKWLNVCENCANPE